MAAAKTTQELGAAGADLTKGMQDVGLERWHRFLADADRRASAASSGAANRPYQVAQANNPYVASDVKPSLVGDPAAAAAPGRYVGDNPRQWAGQPSVGSGECVPLVQAATGALRATEWRPGVPVQGNTAIRPGTAIATFDSNGHYTGHAAIYLGQDTNGIQVVDQWNIFKNGKIVDKHQLGERNLFLVQPGRTRINRGESYRVVE